MSNEKKEDKERVFYITHSGELLIWLIVICVIVGISTITYFINEKKHENVYNIFMPDVDGLIVGSPVRAMGIEVGHVVKIKPTNEDVYVRFIITNKDFQLPHGTIATVEFSGMAGSKSLELYLPDETTYIDNNTPILSVDPPKRLQDAFGLLNDMFTKLGKIIKTSSYFASELKKIDMPKTQSNGNITEFLQYSDKVLDDSILRMEILGGKVGVSEDNGVKRGEFKYERK